MGNLVKLCLTSPFFCLDKQAAGVRAQAFDNFSPSEIQGKVINNFQARNVRSYIKSLQITQLDHLCLI